MANKERASFSLDDDLSSDLEALAKIPPQPQPTSEQKKKMRQVSEKMGFPSREPRLTEDQPKEETQKMTLVIPANLHREFKSKAASNGEKMTEILIRYIQQYINL